MQPVLWECTYRGKWIATTQDIAPSDKTGIHHAPDICAVRNALPSRYREHTFTVRHDAAVCEQTPWASVEFISPKGRIHPHRVDCRPYTFDPETGLEHYLTAAELYA